MPCNKMLGHAGIDEDVEKGLTRLVAVVQYLNDWAELNNPS